MLATQMMCMTQTKTAKRTKELHTPLIKYWLVWWDHLEAQKKIRHVDVYDF